MAIIKAVQYQFTCDSCGFVETTDPGYHTDTGRVGDTSKREAIRSLKQMGWTVCFAVKCPNCSEPTP